MPYNCLNLQITELKRSALSVTFTECRKTITTITEPAQTRFNNYYISGHYTLSCFLLKSTLHRLDSASIFMQQSTQLGPTDGASPYLQTPTPTKGYISQAQHKPSKS
jgi:hypothetical protein